MEQLLVDAELVPFGVCLSSL